MQRGKKGKGDIRSKTRDAKNHNASAIFAHRRILNAIQTEKNIIWFGAQCTRLSDAATLVASGWLMQIAEKRAGLDASSIAF